MGGVLGLNISAPISDSPQPTINTCHMCGKTKGTDDPLKIATSQENAKQDGKLCEPCKEKIGSYMNDCQPTIERDHGSS